MVIKKIPGKNNQDMMVSIASGIEMGNGIINMVERARRIGVSQSKALKYRLIFIPPYFI